MWLYKETVVSYWGDTGQDLTLKWDTAGEQGKKIQNLFEHVSKHKMLYCRLQSDKSAVFDTGVETFLFSSNINSVTWTKTLRFGNILGTRISSFSQPFMPEMYLYRELSFCWVTQKKTQRWVILFVAHECCVPDNWQPAGCKIGLYKPLELVIITCKLAADQGSASSDMR